VRETAVTRTDTDADTDDAADSPTPRPVTILTGSLGAGKTTTLNHLLASSDRDIAVLVNDMGSLNVDAELVDVETTLKGGESRMAELSNGCICCGLQGELRNELFQLAESYEFDQLVIEASGISEPKPIASQLVGGGAVGDRYDLASIVSVVDTPRFAATFDETAERAGTDEAGRKPLADLAIEQVEFCSTIIANKQDLVDDETADRVESLLKSLQPAATIHRATGGKVDPSVLLDETFDPEAVNTSAAWKQVLAAGDTDDHGHDHDHGDDDHGHGHDHEHEHDHGGDEHEHSHDHDHVHPPELYGVDSVTYTRRRPFHPERFDSWLDSIPEGVVRAKGIIWIAGRQQQALTVSIVGQRSPSKSPASGLPASPTKSNRSTDEPNQSWSGTTSTATARFDSRCSDLISTTRF